MKNWRLWLSIIGFLGYPLFFSRFPITRDVPWVSYVLFAIAIVLIFSGARGAFGTGATTGRKVVALIVTFIGVAIPALFIFGILVFAKMLPHSSNAPAVGAKAPGFALPDTNHQTVALSQLLAAPGANGVLLVFYRGYW